MAKEVTLRFDLVVDQVGLKFMQRAIKALHKEGVIKDGDQVHLVEATYSYVVKPPSTSPPR